MGCESVVFPWAMELHERECAKVWKSLLNFACPFCRIRLPTRMALLPHFEHGECKRLLELEFNRLI